MRADKAFVRIVKLRRAKGLPAWGTVAEMEAELDRQADTPEMQTWRTTLTTNQLDTLRADILTVEKVFGRVPYEQAHRVKEKEP